MTKTDKKYLIFYLVDCWQEMKFRQDEALMFRYWADYEEERVVH